jgi:ankyrin repeat protein
LAGFLAVSGLAAAYDIPLISAVEGKDEAAIRRLLAQKVDVDVPRPDGTTALALAVHGDDLKIADLLIRAGANVNTTNDYGVFPLLLACTNGSAPMVEELLKAGADPKAARLSGETALMACSRTGSVEAVKLLLSSGADVNAIESKKGQTALMWAAEQRHLEVARLLIERGATVNVRSRVGFTPLLFAAREGDIDTVRILVDAGANVNEGNHDGVTPLLAASANGFESLSLFLLEKGANPNAADSFGATALHYALLRGMAVMSAVPAHMAENAYVLRPNMPQLVKALLARGANPNAQMVKVPRLPGSTPRFSMVGATPFLLATGSLDISLMRLLVESGADPRLPTKENVTPLMVAAGLGSFEDRTEDEKKSALEVAKLTLELGSDVNAVGENGWTALHGAAYVGEERIMQYLVDMGAKLDVRDVFEQTPFSIAAGEYGTGVLDFTKKPFTPHPAAAKLLLTLGADPRAASVVQRSNIAVFSTRQSSQ